VAVAVTAEAAQLAVQLVVELSNMELVVSEQQVAVRTSHWRLAEMKEPVYPQ